MKYNIGDILEGNHIPDNPIHLLIEDVIYLGKEPIFYCVRNLQDNMTYDKTVERIDRSLYYRRAG